LTRSSASSSSRASRTSIDGRRPAHLERDPDDLDVLASIFRAIHTIKGTCGFLGLRRLERVTHVGENLLSKLRDGELQVDADIATALLATVDAVRGMLAAIESTGSDGEEDHATSSPR
jgi:two-component system, chemotaxis family, sensor kinase CheA